jgi:hypothetical protein
VTAMQQLADIQIMQVVHVRLQDFDHLCRDLEQSLVLSGVKNDTLERKLMAVRESIEVASAIAREA